MNGERVTALIELAIQLTKDAPENYRIAAFQEVLRHLLAREGAFVVHETGTTVASGERPPSIGEFLKMTGAKSYTEVTLVMGYYLLKYRGLEKFTVNELDALFAEARQPRTNTNAAIIGNIRKGMMIDTGEKREQLKLFAVSRLGEEFVQSGLLAGRSAGE